MDFSCDQLCPGHTFTDHLTVPLRIKSHDDPGNAYFHSLIGMHSRVAMGGFDVSTKVKTKSETDV